MLRNPVPKTSVIPISLGLLALVALAAMILPLMPRAAQASERDERNGDLYVTKECSHATGAAGGYCTITSSTLGVITIGSKVFYDQAAGIPTGLLDSNVVLDAGNGNMAVGRCTLVFATGRGLCTFSDGTGQFTGFHARVDVAYLGGVDYSWSGTYSFSPEEHHRQ
jgi:hypothetical protein